MIGMYNSTIKKYIKTIKVVLVITVCFLSVGFSAFTSQLGINGISAQVRVQKDVRIRSVLIESTTSDASYYWEYYNVRFITSGISLPNSDSTITFNVQVVNVGNTEAILKDITGLSDNLTYTLNNYTFNDTLCDDDDSTLCTLGSTTTISITIGYKDNAYNSESTDHYLDLNFEFGYLIDAVAKIGDTFYDTLVEAVAAVPESSEETTTILLLKDTSELVNIGANKNVILDLNDKTVSNLDSTNVIINDGTLTIRNGTVYCSAEQGAINNESTGVLVIDGARIIGTGRQAIYNNGGETTINEGSYLKSTSVNRATVQNLSSGTVRIKGGTIISTKFSAVISTATLIIGEKGGETSNSSPVIQGESYGIDNTSSKTPIYFYDGVLKGKNKGIAVENKITEIEPEYELITKSEVIEGSTYTISFLGHGVTVTFNPDGGTAEFTTKSVPEGFEIGTLPGASKTGYTFLGWFDSDNNPISPSTIIEENVTYIAHWLKTTGVAQIGNNVYDTLQQAINASNSTGTTITLLKNTSEAITVAASKNVILNMGEYTLSNNGNKAVIENKGTISINGGTIASTATTGAINQVSGTVTINNARVVATGTRQALYITGGTAIITGDSYLESSTDGVYSNMDRCTVQNVTGTLKIYGGTIVGKKQHAVGNADILEIGTQDGNINTSSPNLMGAIYGVKNTGTFRFYDGIIKGASAAINGTVTEQEANSTIIDGFEDPYHTAHLE